MIAMSFFRLLFADGWILDLGIRARVAQLFVPEEAFVYVRYVIFRLAVLVHG